MTLTFHANITLHEDKTTQLLNPLVENVLVVFLLKSLQQDINLISRLRVHNPSKVF